MKKSLNSLKALAVGAALAAAAIAAPAAPANALSLSFENTGTSLDGDVIKDIEVAVGDLLVFDLLLETFGVATDDTVNTVQYKLTWDKAELGFQGFNAFDPLGTISEMNLASNVLTVKSIGSALRNLSGLQVGRINFKVLAGLDNSGATDFSSEFLSALDEDGDTLPNLVSSQVQTVEVQQAVPTPALLPGLIGMGMALVRKRRNQAEQAA
ncbi:MAG: PTPA-CTERM sorting domain-containing protein [Synechococcales cyanobacterium RU_4_20]|nr:PTPA-CTERM sorting domain-containing protein [Synechococcales cyanobacterium RU_4_20]NJR70208.1 PTPA-CTERM sorting domain-containing protein [Synechococcales cyanobacterium CRU_2_2]